MSEYEDELVYMSKYVGMRSDYVQAGGGNTSIKISEENMIIKSSGVQLSDISKNYGISYVNYLEIKNNLYKKIELVNEKKILEESTFSGNIPSIETFLHSITYKYTIHVHSTIINILTCQKNGMEILKKLFPTGIFVDYATPGIELAYKVIESCKNNSKRDIIFLKNHGIIVSSDKLEDTINLLENSINIVAEYLKININKYNNISYLYKIHIKAIENFSNIIYLCENEDISKALMKNKGNLWNYLLFPDAVVYCGSKYLNLTDMEDRENIKAIIENKRNVLIAYCGNIYINTISLKKAKEIETVLASTAQIFLNVNEEQLDYINTNQQNKINTSETEKYRKTIS